MASRGPTWPPEASGKGAQAVEVEDLDAPVFDLEQAGLLEHLQRLVGALARDAGEVAELLLRELHVGELLGIEDRVEERGERAGDARIRLQQPFVLHHRDKLPEALVQLHEEEAIELDAAAEEPLEGRARH